MAGGLDKPVVHFVHSEQNHKASQSILTAVGLASLQPRAVALLRMAMVEPTKPAVRASPPRVVGRNGGGRQTKEFIG